MPFMAVGLFGPRDIDKNVFRALIQPYDGSNHSHVALAKTVADAEDVASKIDVTGAKTFQSARRLVKVELGKPGILSAIEELVLDVVPTATP